MALVDKHVADEAAGGAECRPTATAGVGVIVGALPRELGAGGAITGAVPHVEVRFDGSEDHLAVVLSDERDVRRLKKVKVFPLVHLGDPPPPCKAPGKGRRTLRHPQVSAPSLGRRRSFSPARSSAKVA